MVSSVYSDEKCEDAKARPSAKEPPPRLAFVAKIDDEKPPTFIALSLRLNLKNFE